ncbi:MAG TPA: trypsin-like peptidase domain-containing protein [Gemmatimonadales bacterium]|nr:trypsin-like peptidase domain-containing protein [Gemmatimonadales bacterium]
MKAQFTFLSGSRTGQTDIFSQAHISIGRHPQSELRFDADKDLDVSSRHAAVTLVGEFYVLRDLGSTNGTLVNGRKLSGEHVLASGDVLTFGANGPRVEFTVIGAPRTGAAAAPEPPAAKAPGTVVFGSQEPPAAPPPPKLSPEQQRSPRRTPGPGTQTKVRLEVRRQTRSLRNTTLGLFALLLVVAAAYLWQVRQTDRVLAAQRQLLLGTVDSLMQQITLLSQGSEGLRAALDSAQSEAGKLRALLAEAPNDEAQIAELRTRLEAALRQQRSLAGAATMDARALTAANRDAMAMVFVEFPGGQVVTGTAFAVRSDPTGGLLITNKHVVVDSNGTIASRIGVVFEGTRQNFRADLVKVSPDADLALLRASVHRGFPVVKALADSARALEPGEPAAVLGFPLGLDLAGGRDWTTVGVASTVTLGTVSRVQPSLVQLDGYGAQGSSGSPILDRTGVVVGILYGGQPGSNGRILYGVPVRFAQRLLSDAE